MKKEPNNRILKANHKLQEACEALRQYVDNRNQAPDIALRGGIYQGIDLNVVQTAIIDGVEIGYKVQDFNTFMRRTVYIKVPGYFITDISKREREQIMAAVFNAFVIEGAAIPEIIGIAPDCLRLQQDVIPMVLVEKSPGLRSIAGGFNGN